MAIDNVQAVRFCNEKVRPLADELARAYFRAKAVAAEWYANNMGAIIPVDGGLVVDGSATDGRPPITGNDATNIIVRATELIADYEASTNAKLNTIMKVQVNGA